MLILSRYEVLQFVFLSLTAHSCALPGILLYNLDIKAIRSMPKIAQTVIADVVVETNESSRTDTQEPTTSNANILNAHQALILAVVEDHQKGNINLAQATIQILGLLSYPETIWARMRSADSSNSSPRSKRHISRFPSVAPKLPTLEEVEMA